MATEVIDVSYPVEGPMVTETAGPFTKGKGVNGCHGGAGDSDSFAALPKFCDAHHPRSIIMDASSTSMGGYDSPSSTPREDECPSSDRSVDKTFGLPVEDQLVEESAWSRCVSSEGYDYYVNDVTGESVWQLPPGAVLSNVAIVPDTPPVLAYDTHGRPYYWTESTGTWVYAQDSDWTMSFDERYMCHYFVNTVTGDSSWEHPMWSARAAEHSASVTTDFAAIDAHRKQLARRKAGVRGRIAWQEAVQPTDGYGDGCSDDDTTSSDSGSDSDDEDVDEVLEQLGEVDGAVVGLTLAQRARWTQKKLAQVTGSVISNLSTAAQNIVYNASPLLTKALPALQAAKERVTNLCSPHSTPELPFNDPSSRRRRFTDADAAVYNAMHGGSHHGGFRARAGSAGMRPPAIHKPGKTGGATAPRTPKVRPQPLATVAEAATAHLMSPVSSTTPHSTPA